MDTLLARDSGPEMAALWSDAKRHLRTVLATLTPREERIIRLRFGLDGVGEHTYEACDPSVTRERVRQIEAKALRKLRHPKRLQKLSLPWTSKDWRDIVFFKPERNPVSTAAAKKREAAKQLEAEQQAARQIKAQEREAAWLKTHEYRSRQDELEAKRALIGKVSEEEFRGWLFKLYANERGTVDAMMQRAEALSIPSSASG